MTAAVWGTVLLLSVPRQTQSAANTTPQEPAQTQSQGVSLVDVLVEGQTLYTLAVDKQPESLTAALELARQAQKAVAEDTVRKRLNGARPDQQDLTVLGSLRARISILVSTIEKRREYFNAEFETIQKLLQRKRLDEARLALDYLAADAPTADPVVPFADLRAQLEQASAQAKAKASSGKPSSKLITQGIIWTAALAGAGVAAHISMNNSLDEMDHLFPGSSQWWASNDDAERMRTIRNGFVVAAFGVGAAFTIYGAAKAARNNKSPSRLAAPFGPRTFVGFSFDPRNPAIQVVRIF